MFGQLVTVANQPGRVLVSYFFSRPHFGTNEAEESFVVAEGNKSRQFVLCPACDKRRSILWFTDRWACGACHKLLYRTQVVSPVARKAERLGELVRMLANKRPKYMRESKYRALRREHKDLERELSGVAIPSLRKEHEVIFVAKWKRPAEVKELWVDTHEIRGDKLLVRPPIH